MRVVLSAVLLAGLSLPALAVDATSRERVEDLVPVLQAERLRLDGVAGPEAAVAGRCLVKGERALQRLVRRHERSEGLESVKLRLFAQAGKWIARATDNGAVARDSALVLGWQDAFGAYCDDFADVVRAATNECERLVTDSLRERVAARLEKGLALCQEPIPGGGDLERLAVLARGLVHVQAALKKACVYCERETRPSCPRGVTAENQALTYRGRGSLTVFDLSWDITLRNERGDVVRAYTGRLGDQQVARSASLPLLLARGESLDALQLAAILPDAAYRVDGTLVWRTSAGEIEVALHLTP